MSKAKFAVWYLKNRKYIRLAMMVVIVILAWRFFLEK